MTEISLDTTRFNNGERSDKTLETYSHDIKIIKNLFKTNESLMDSENIIKMLKEKYTSNHTIRNKLSFINSYLRTLEETPEVKKVINNNIKEMKILNYDIGKQNARHEKTDKQKANWITNDDWTKLLERYKLPERPIVELKMVDKNGKEKICKFKTISYICDHKGNNNMFSEYLRKYRDFIILSIYKQVALRNDLIDTVILPSTIYKVLRKIKDPTLNHIIINKKTKEIKLILTNYKTAKIQGEKEIPLEDNENHDLYNALFMYYEIGAYMFKQYKENYPKVYLLCFNDGSPMSGNSFCQYFKSLGKCIGKELSTTLIRHCKVSEIYNLEKLEKMAHYMGHSVREALTVYAKI
jgi:hypothetical protein